MDEDLPRVPPIPVTWTPQGGDDALTWKRQKGSTTKAGDDHEEFQTTLYPGKRILTAKIKKKMLDKEIPYKEILHKDLPLYHLAEIKEWDDWIKNKSVRIVKGKEVQDIYRDTPSTRFINLRFVYRDKNASIRTPQT